MLSGRFANIRGRAYGRGFSSRANERSKRNERESKRKSTGRHRQTESKREENRRSYVSWRWIASASHSRLEYRSQRSTEKADSFSLIFLFSRTDNGSPIFSPAGEWANVKEATRSSPSVHSSFIYRLFNVYYRRENGTSPDEVRSHVSRRKRSSCGYFLTEPNQCSNAVGLK